MGVLGSSAGVFGLIMIPFYLISQNHSNWNNTPEQRLAVQMGNPPFPVKEIDGGQQVRDWLENQDDDHIGFIFDPEFWYGKDCWNEWIGQIAAEPSDMEIQAPLGGQNPSWRNGLNIPLYVTLRQLEQASGFCSTTLWKTARAERPDDFAVAVVPACLLRHVPKNMTLMDLPLFWADSRQSIRIFCKGWLHPFSAVRDEGRRDDLVDMCEWKGAVLELGCGTGLMGANCHDKGFDVRWIGLDIDRTVLRQATAHVDMAIQADLNRNLPFDPSCRFDRIVCGDVLEHLPYPWEFLKRLRDHVKPDGLLIASFPNIGHWSVIEDLLSGRWDETPSGIFCVSHLRFGTRITWEKWFVHAGWEIMALERETLPPPEFWPPIQTPGIAVDIPSLETIRYRILARPGNPNPS